MSLRRLEGKVAVVTGAASGIGRALATALAAEGCSLALADRNVEGLKATAALASGPKVRVRTYEVDVGNEDSMRTFAKAVEDEYGRIHLLINNAGVTVTGEFSNQSLEDFRWVVDVNFWGVVYGCKFFIPQLERAGEGCIVNLSSLFGLVGVPMQTSYCATKFAVRGFSESLGAELADSNIDVVSVHPGGISTDIIKNAKVRGREAQRINAGLLRHFETKTMSPDRAAHKIIRGIKRGSPRVLITRETYATDVIKRVLPALHPKVMNRARSLLKI
jgi:NAD(P)-dependent dehydrogenase (short-subunit alcohol dehydrogenase family)